MEPLDLHVVEKYVNENVVNFHERRIDSLRKMRIKTLINKNPYLFRAKNVTTAGEMVNSLLEARLSSSEEEMFGRFLEGLAIFVAERTSGGRKSAAPGVDLEFIDNGVLYLVSVKSGTNWGNASQHNDLEQHLKTAVIRVKQRDPGTNVQPVVGICYGRTRTAHNERRGWLKIVGQNFWYFVSENKELYMDIIHPIGYEAKQHNQLYLLEKSKAANRLTRDFIQGYCDESGEINWPELVRSVSGNYDLDKFLPARQSP